MSVVSRDHNYVYRNLVVFPGITGVAHISPDGQVTPPAGGGECTLVVKLEIDHDGVERQKQFRRDLWDYKPVDHIPVFIWST